MLSEKRMVEGYEITKSFEIGKTEIILGEKPNAPDNMNYLVANCENNEIFTRYNDVLIGDDFAELRLPGKPSKRIDLDNYTCELKSPIATWVDSAVYGASDEIYGIDAAVDMVKFMLAAYKSSEEKGKRIAIHDGEI